MTRPLHILVIDDDFATRLLACEALEAEGFTTNEVESGDEALEKIAEAPPDAVLLDVNMPGIDGYEVCRRLRARPDGEDLSIMVMTATDDRDAVERAFAAGATDFMTKPLNLPLLGHRMRFMQRAANAAAAAREAARKAKRDELQILQLAYYDDVTGIPNTRFVEHFLEGSDSTRISTITIDLGIAAIPRLTQGARDAFVRSAAMRVLHSVRGEDEALHLDQLPCAPEGFGGPTFVARTSIDELTVVNLTHASPTTTAREIALALSEPFQFDGRTVTLHPGFGIASYPDPVSKARDLYTDAVYALQHALRAAPRDIVVFGSALRDRRMHREELTRRLALALDTNSDDLVPMYSPRRDVHRRLIGVRASTEYLPLEDDHATLSIILAANPRLPQRLSQWALVRACRDAGTWLRAGAALRVAVEVPSAVTLESGFVHGLLAAIEDADFDPHLLDLELVELPVVEADMARVAQIVAHLRERGVRVFLARIDDVFLLRGFTCLAVDGLRLDHGTLEHRGPRFLSTVCSIAKALELSVAVAGVDAPASMRTVASFDIAEVAGDEIGEPLIAERVPRLASESVDPTPMVHRGLWDTLSPSFTID